MTEQPNPVCPPRPHDRTAEGATTVPLRVLILNQPFAPDVVATAQIAKDLADALVLRGHHVTAIASRSIYGETGAALPKREVIDGIEIRRVGASLFGKHTTIGRIADFAMYFIRATLLGLTGEKPDIVIALTTPPYIALTGVLLKRWRGVRLLYWLMDIYPDVMIAHGMIRDGSIPHRLLRRLHRIILNRADAVIALGRCMKDRLIAQGAQPDSIHLVRPWSPALETNVPERDANRYRSRWNAGERLVVMYSGNFGLAHDIDTFLHAADRLRDDDRFLFAFVGGGKRRPMVDAFVRSRKLDNCVLEDYQPLEQLPELLAAADVHLVTMTPSMSGLVVPSKFFGVAGAARATIFIGPRTSEIARCIEDWSAGVVIEPDDVPALLAALSRFATSPATLLEMGRRAHRGFEQCASRFVCTRRIVELVEAAPSSSGADHAIHHPETA